MIDAARLALLGEDGYWDLWRCSVGAVLMQGLAASKTDWLKVDDVTHAGNEARAQQNRDYRIVASNNILVLIGPVISPDQ